MHVDKVHKLQEEIQCLNAQSQPINLHYQKGHSNTTRSKAYNNIGHALDCSALNQVIELNIEKRRIVVEPRVTMKELVNATLPHGLMPPIIPEFKGITVGGALMGAAAESMSHKWGIFFDCCTQATILSGKGDCITCSATENADVFYGLSGSYGSLGLLVSAELQLIPIKRTVHVRYHRFSNPLHALKKLEELTAQIDFLDGIVFSREHTVIVEGALSLDSPSQKRSAWYAQHVQTLPDGYEERMPLRDYLFRFDEGAFWMGAFLFQVPFLARYIREGLLGRKSAQEWFTEKEIRLFKTISYPKSVARTLFRPLLDSQKLWSLLHKAEKWVQDRLIIQDFCIPHHYAPQFLSEVLEKPGTFPMWLCPLKSTHSAQIFAPHQNSNPLINIGIYGCPSYSAPMKQIIHNLEQNTYAYGGRKVLYSRSYYTEDMFWEIYPKTSYELLRKKTHANGVWRAITEKVLSE